MDANIDSSGAPTNTSSGGMFLTFSLEGEEYGLEILKVREIIGLLPITPVPRAPEYVVGVINLRGRVIPVVNIRTKFDMAPAGPTEETCIIVVEIGSEDHIVTIGFVVDQVAEVVDIPSNRIDPPPDFAANVDDRHISGIGNMSDRIIILLEIEKILSLDEHPELAELGAS